MLKMHMSSHLCNFESLMCLVVHVNDIVLFFFCLQLGAIVFTKQRTEKGRCHGLHLEQLSASGALACVSVSSCL